MMPDVCHNRRALVVLILLCVMVFAQSAALFSAIEPHHATGHCCILCHVGSLPFLGTGGVVAVAPTLRVERLSPNSDHQSTHDVLLNANSSRAPPA
jgi:hypothetical protein